MTQEFFDVEVARECGVNAAAVASYLWHRFREDPEMKYRHGASIMNFGESYEDEDD